MRGLSPLDEDKFQMNCRQTPSIYLDLFDEMDTVAKVHRLALDGPAALPMDFSD